MIVKIEMHSKKQDQDWWLFDNIAKLSCSKKLKRGLGRSDINVDDDNVLLLDYSPECECDKNSSCSKCIPYYRLVCRTKDWQEFSIVFDTIAYICNDDGKTIEKIVANYK